MPRRAPGKFSKGWLYGGIIVEALVAGVFLFLTAPLIVGAWPAYLGAGGLATLFTWLLIDRVERGETFVAKPWLGISLIGAGYGLGYAHIALEPKKDRIYKRNDYAVRTGIYVTVEVGSLVTWLVRD